MKAATMKQRGPQVNCAFNCISMDELPEKKDLGCRKWLGRRTAVTVSMQSTKGSEVKYRESESAYSFHSWPNRS